jgi:murein L,D-transpeptidase YafK
MFRYPVLNLLFVLLVGCGIFLPGHCHAGSEIYFAKLTDNVIIDSIAVHKAEHEMLVFSHGVLLKKYIVQLGPHPVGPKQSFGDGKTPEGHYIINAMNPHSLFHKSLGISYPNTDDMERAIKLGRSPGGDIVIHGLPNGEEHVRRSRYRNDWTRGCIAVRNEEIDELFEHVRVGTPLVITP